MNEKGSVLLIAMMILMLASLIAVSSVGISTQETRIAGNEKMSTSVFFNADAGIAPGTKVLLETFVNKSVGSYPSLDPTDTTTTECGTISTGWDADTLVSGTNKLLDEILGVETSGKGFSFRASATDPLCTKTHVRIQRKGQTTRSSGSSTEFGSGYEGVGYGSAGGVLIYYYVRSTASDRNSNSSSLETEYRRVLRVGAR